MEESMSRLCFDLDQSSFFCDGPSYLILSHSLGGCSFEDFCRGHYRGNTADRKALMQQGVYLPLGFGGDCMLDDALILVGDLTPEEARVGIKAFNGKLNIPCGQLLIFCGGEADDEYLRETLNQQQEQHQGFAWVNVPPGEYLTELYATPQRFILRLSPLTAAPPDANP